METLKVKIVRETNIIKEEGFFNLWLGNECVKCFYFDLKAKEDSYAHESKVRTRAFDAARILEQGGSFTTSETIYETPEEKLESTNI